MAQGLMRTQLRDYRIAAGRLDEFVTGWRAGVLPLRRRFGFTVVAAWTVPEEDGFGWLVRYDGPLTLEEADAAYYDSPERAPIKPDPADLIIENVSRFVDEIDLEGITLRTDDHSPLRDSPP